MYQVVGQRYFVEGGRVLQQVQLEDPDTGESHSTVQDTGVDAPPGSEGESADSPDELASKLERGTGLPSNDYNFTLTPPGDRPGTTGGSGFGQSLASAARGAYGGYTGDSAGANPASGFGASTASAARGAAPPPGDQQMAPRDNQYLNQNAGTAAAQAAARSGAPVGSDVPGTPDPTGERARALTLYNEEDPQAALQNVLLDRGLNPFNAGNPVISMMMRAAPALAMAYRIAGANQEGITGQSLVDSPNAFRDFLGNAIAQGKTLSAGPAAAQAIPAIIDKIRALADQATPGVGGPTVGGVGGLGGNPFVEIMNQLLGKDFGGGTTDILAALLGPAMTRGTAAGYRAGLNRDLSMAQRRYDFGAEAKGEKTDIYKFLFGR
jgi:hypothetical protein